MTEDRLMTAEEVAAMLRVTAQWVYAHARSGDLPKVPVGRYVRFWRSDVLAWIDTKRTRRLTSL